MVHTPYQDQGVITSDMVEYLVGQFESDLIPALEKISGKKFDIDRLRSLLQESKRAEDDLVYCFQSGKNIPSPIDGFFAGVYYVGPIFTAFRGTPECTEYYRTVRREIEYRVANKLGPDDAGRDPGRREVPPGNRRHPKLDGFPGFLEDFL